MYSCVIIDDEPDGIEILGDYIDLMPNLQLYKSYTNPVDAMTEIRGGNIELDLIFMDINMPYISGIELSEIIRKKTKYLILTTAHNQYAVEAFNINASGYLLKPINFSKFAETVNKVISPGSYTERTTSEEDNTFFFVKLAEERNNFVKVQFKDIIAVESLKNYIQIYTANEKIVTYLTLKEISVILFEYADFVQVHRSFIISKNYIGKIESNMIKLSNGLDVPLGASYKDDFSSYLNSHIIRTNRLK
ncbi:LytR/AlgR family response regulator transcription factor [Pontibacter silvestris]|nr:LytTR family DNA-binding domain-containing protein [Pontibacter silvestris]MCC9138806.1 LytTR family DNA-binding domain-containing protein [Pontibacter silvestris]